MSDPDATEHVWACRQAAEAALWLGERRAPIRQVSDTASLVAYAAFKGWKPSRPSPRAPKDETPGQLRRLAEWALSAVAGLYPWWLVR